MRKKSSASGKDSDLHATQIVDLDLRGDRFVRTAFDPPDQAAEDHETDSDKLRAAHHAAEHLSAARIAAQEFDEESGNTVEDQVRAEDLAIELLALQHPHEHEEIRQFDCRLKQLRGLQGHVQRSIGDAVSNFTCESHAPPRVSGLSETASGGKTANSPDRMTDRQSGRECVTCRKRRHAVLADVPDRSDQRANQAPRENSPGLQGVQAEDVCPMRICVPIVCDVQELGAYDSTQYDQNAEIPGLFRIDSLAG